MSRIEKGTAMNEQMNQMKGEVVREIQKSQKKKNPRAACSVLFLIVFLGVIVFVLWLMAASGLVNIPVVSNAVYSEPVPTRVVTPGVPAQTIAEETLKTTLIRRIQANQGTLTDTSVVLELSEESLTASLRSAIKQSDSTVMQSEDAQVVVSAKNGFELFVPVVMMNQESVAQLHADLQVVENQLGIQITKFSLGNVSIPSALVGSMLQPILDSQLSNINESLGSFASVSAISYFDGHVKIGGDFNVEIQEP